MSYDGLTFDPVESDLNHHLTKLDRGDAKYCELKQRYPLSDFEDQAVAALINDGFMEQQDGAISPETATAAAERIALFKVRPDLVPSTYPTDLMVRDEAVVREFVAAAMEEICTALQAEKLKDPWVWWADGGDCG